MRSDDTKTPPSLPAGTGDRLAGKRNSNSARLALCISLAGLALLLTGCASTLSARVTSYQQWPADAAGASYQIEPSPNPADSLQYQTVADMLRAAIGRTGLVEATGSVTPRFVVSFNYSNPESQAWVQESPDPFFWGGPGPWVHPWVGWYGGWGDAVMLAPPPVVNVPVTVYKNTLTVSINDNTQSGQQVYQATAIHESSEDNLAGVMPYLARAIFDGFPGNNGQVRVIRFELGQ